MQKDSTITAIKGIGAKTADSFAKMGVYTVGDILLRFPRTYVQYPKPEPAAELSVCGSLFEADAGGVQNQRDAAGDVRNRRDAVSDGRMHAVAARVRRAPVVRRGSRMQVTVLEVGGECRDDGSDGQKLELVWYRMPYIKNNLTVGHYYIFTAKLRSNPANT